jgi:predicted P-loop ATPase
VAVRGFDGKIALDRAGVEHLVNAKLKASGLGAKDGVSLGITPLTGVETAALGLWRMAAYPGMRFAYHDINGSDTNRYRVRCLADPLPVLSPHPKTGKPRRFPKYVQPLDTAPWAYFPRLPGVDWPSVLSDSKKDIIITEGELKAASATKAGFPTIGLGGVWCFGSNDRGIDFLEELERVTWEGRRVLICYDRDVPANPMVDKALRSLASRLDARGAQPFRVSLPELKPGEKVGLDDFLAEKGAAAFRTVLAAAEEVKPWQRLYQLSSTGSPVPNLNNSLVALRNAPELQDAFAFDLMARSEAVVSPLLSDPENFVRRPREDHDDLLVQRWLQNEGWLTRIGAEPVRAAIDMRARERSFHPVRDYLLSVKWDGTHRLTSWVATYLGAEATLYAQTVGPMFVISMVARVFEPGCKVDYTLVLEGGQGNLKSMAWRTLAGDEHFSDSLPAIEGDEKRLLQHLRGKWLIEIAELASIKKAEIEDVKKFLTRQVDKFTPMYGRKEVTEPRQCVFAASTNEHQYLRDETGNRRFWPVVVGEIDVDALRRDRDQLLAEATHRYQAGEAWHPDKATEASLIQPEQNDRFVGGEWDDKIEKFLEDQVKLASSGGSSYRVTTPFIAEVCLNFGPDRINSEVCRRIASALMRLGWLRTKSCGKFQFSPPETLAKKILASRMSPKQRVIQLAEERKKKY